MTRDLRSRFLRHVTDERLFAEPGLALLAVSGGPDSVALLDLLSDVAPTLGVALAVAHVDHGIGRESATVAERVVSLATRYGLPCHRVGLSLGVGTSETEAREARYRALFRLKKEASARYLVTAHHADDQVETVLFRVLKGSGTAGLAGIPGQTQHGLVRPLLPFTRTELADWLRAREEDLDVVFPVHHDPANADERHDRSWIRHRLLPRLRGRFGRGVEHRLLDLARYADQERRAWSTVLRALPDLDCRVQAGRGEVARPPLREYDKLLSEALLRALAREAGCALSPRRAARLWRFAIAAPSGRRLELGGGWEAEIAFDRLRIVSPVWVRQASEPALPRPWGGVEPGRIQWGRWEIGWEECRALEPVRASFTTWVTAGGGQVRGLATGDALVPLGGIGHRKVRRLLMEARIPWRERGSYPLLVRGEAVVWIPGICRSSVAVPPRGMPALRVEVHATRDA